MTSAHRGKKSPPRRRYGIRTVMMLLSILLALYSIGFLGIYIWTEDIDIIQKTRNVLGMTNVPSPTIIKEDITVPPKPVRQTPKPKPRNLKEETVDSPIIDEFTESIQAGRPVLPKEDEEDIVSLPKTKLAEGISLDKPLTPLRCWDARGFEYKADKCDSLYALNQLLKSKLNLFTACRDALKDNQTSGRITFFAEVDFLRNATSFWRENTTGAQNRGEILSCVSEQFASISLKNLPHRHSRYRLTGQVRFEGSRQTTLGTAAGKTRTTSKAAIAKLEKALAAATEVEVTKERVRVRKSPVDGEIIGFISYPAKVKLVEKSDDWCLIKTKRDNVGWIVCWGLAADETKTENPKAEKAEYPDKAISVASKSPKTDTTSSNTTGTSVQTHQDSKPAPLPTAANLAKALRAAKEVSVTKQRLRVRKEPIDGEIIRFISHPTTVKLIEKRDDWCLIKTKRGQMGWMVCWGLDIRSTSSPVDESNKTETPKIQ